MNLNPPIKLTMSTNTDLMSASKDSTITSPSQEFLNILTRTSSILDLLYPSTVTESPRTAQARDSLSEVVQYLRNLVEEAEWKEKKLAGEEVRNARLTLAKHDKGFWVIDQAFVLAVINGQHDDRIGYYVMRDIEHVCLGHDRASLTFAEFEERLASVLPATEEEHAGLFELKEMVSKAKAGTPIPVDWTGSHIADRGIGQ